ncbi:MAG TPA: LysE family translocator [Solirubrobacteraceae bacterium]|jgi:threonine/homoserine/homoserine lactone efflux protein|nr:LysE family translocator [Solirubrobacteraceae bacterium]
MLHTLLTFVPVAALLSITPGAATALVVRNAARGGRRHAFFTTSGNSIGVLAWACFAAIGIAAVVAASAAVFDAVKLAGATVLVVIGVRSLLSGGARATARSGAVDASEGAAFREGLLTSLANPKLAVFFVALFPQFIPRGAAVLPSALAMAAVIVAVDLVWYSTLALLVARARKSFVDGGWGRRVERLTGAVLVGLGIRLALERR